MKIEKWKEALESKGFKISRINTECMQCNFTGDVKRAKTSTTTKAQEIQQGDLSNTFGLMISNGEIEEDIKG